MIDRIKDFIRKWWIYRSAQTGRFVSRDFAEHHPDVTTKEEVK